MTMKYNYPFKFIFIAVLLCMGLLNSSYAQQTGVPFNQRDDNYRLLGLKRAKSAYEAAKASYQKKEKLFSEQLISEQELLEAKNRFSDAEVNYQQSTLAVLFESQYISVVDAVKYQSKTGKKMVRLRLANTSGSSEFKQFVNFEDDIFRSLRPDVVHDVYISLLNDDNAIISQPYEAKIEKLEYGKPVDLHFSLLQDLDMVTVNLMYGNGTQRSPKIFLQKDESANRVLVQSQQFSQEVQLGGSASFDLTLELFSGRSNTYKLAVVNLPSEINSYFVDPRSKARLSQFKFTEQTNTRNAALQVYLPDRPSEVVISNKPLPFFILIIPTSNQELIRSVNQRTWSEEDIKILGIGYTRLELIPKGIGKLFVRAPQLYYQTDQGEAITTKINLKNEGSRSLVNIDIEVDLPLRWRKEIIPAALPDLNINQEEMIDVVLIPPIDVVPGKYEVRIKTYSLSDDQPVRGEEKTITIEILPETNLIGTLVIILIIIATISAIVIFGIRLTRR